MILIHIPKYRTMDREIAIDILMKYKQEQSYLNLTLNHVFSTHSLTKESKSLITHLVYGTIQNQIYLEYMLEPHLKSRVKSFEKILLLMSLYQHYFLDHIPDYAIVNEAVQLAKKRKGMKTSKFINAVLKNALSTSRSLDHLEERERLSIETSHPSWMVKMLEKQYGLETTKKICYANNDIPYKTARVNTIKTTREKLLENKLFEKGMLSEDALYYHGGNIAGTNEFKNGLVTIQDESSQMVARLLNPHPHDYVLDMCCAPGGKTAHLAAIMKNQGKIDAYDLYEHKILLVNGLMERLGIEIVNVKCYDATKLKNVYHGETFDKILLDGPCSGLGVLSRKPEIKYHNSSIMDKIIEIQRELLDNAYALLKNDGSMVYSTCTINKKENEKQIQWFIEKYPDMKVIKEMTILPYEYHSDGFYMCLLKKEY